MAKVARLVGGFPLLITALEHYRKTAEVLDVRWKYRMHCQNLEQVINTKKLAYEEKLQEFLGPIVETKLEMNKLIDNPSSKL